MQIAPGFRLAQYEITALLGRGGMGAVYRARDTKLQRDVAVKLLPEELTRETDRLARFHREARLLASLNHPHIASIYDLLEEGGASFLIMELIEGRTLESRLQEGPLPLDEAVAIARQIAEALEAAHQKGIVHRDLKPANVMISREGRVKILDFGLARGLDDETVEPDLSHSPTLLRVATHAGIILGTAAYMSPEQARGKRVDARTDTWAFGVILWEMLMGRRLFEGDTVSDILASVLTREIDFSALPREIPPNVVWLLRRCLSRDANQRIYHGGDLRVTLDAEPMRSEPHDTSSPLRRRSGYAAVAGLAIALLTLTAIALVRLRPGSSIEPLHASIALPDGSRLALTGIQPGPPVISPDGTHIAIVLDEAERRRRIWIRELASGQMRVLEGTDGASYPFWSADGLHIGFFANEKLRRIPAAGGTVVNIANAPNAKGGSWNRDDVILFAPTFNSPIFKVGASGGLPAAVTTVNVAGGDSGHRFPQFLPDGNRFLCFVRKRGDTGHRTVIASLDGQPEQTLLENDVQAIAAGDHLFFLRDGTLMVQPFDADHARLEESPVPIATDVRIIRGANRLVADASERALVLQRGEMNDLTQLLWVSRTGETLADVGQPLQMLNRRLSPDGARIAVNTLYDLWIFDGESGNRERLTFDGSVRSASVWSPDGRRIAYASTAGEPLDIRITSVPASGEARVIVRARDNLRLLRPSSWSSDEGLLLYEEEDPSRNITSIYVAEIDSTEDPRKVTDVSVRTPNPRFSPDGRWIAYANLNDEGVPTVFVTPWPALNRHWQVGSGEAPFWRHDGRELFYHGIDGYVQAVAVQAADTNFAWGTAERLFQIYTAPESHDGNRFLVSRDLGEGRSEPLDLILNWRRLVISER